MEDLSLVGEPAGLKEVVMALDNPADGGGGDGGEAVFAAERFQGQLDFLLADSRMHLAVFADEANDLVGISGASLSHGGAGAWGQGAEAASTLSEALLPVENGGAGDSKIFPGLPGPMLIEKFNDLEAFLNDLGEVDGFLGVFHETIVAGKTLVKREDPHLIPLPPSPICF
jgi:hypothetical protein